MQTLKRLPQIYNNICEKKPFTTITISTGFILGLGDVMTQYLEYYNKKQTLLKDTQLESSNNSMSLQQQKIQKSSSKNIKIQFQFDPKRTLCMAAYGWTCFGPLSYYWYCRILPRVVPIAKGMTINNKQLFQKILLDETIQSWTFYLTFLYLMTRYEGGSHKNGVQKVEKDFWTCYKADLMIWPFVQYVNFKFVPLHLQSLVVSTTTVFWGAFLSYVQHRD